MGEPISLALVGGVLTEGFKFLFEQASSLVRAARARRADAKAAAEGAEAPEVVVVPVPDTGVLDGPVAATVDGRLLDRESRRLIALAGALAPYASGDAEIDTDDVDLMAALAERTRSGRPIRTVRRCSSTGRSRPPARTSIPASATS